MGVYTTERQVKVPDGHFRVNITRIIEEEIEKSGFREGHGVVQIKHTTTGLFGVKIQEDESGLMNDLDRFLRFLDKLLPEDAYYEHDDYEKRTENLEPEQRKNATAHLKASLLSTSENFIFKNGNLLFGTWQSILLFDFDPEGRPHRDIVIQVCGEK